MPRSGSGIYTKPPGTDGVPNTTVASVPYNTYTDDVTTDLNAPRPVVAGGTGSTNVHDALIALHGEESKQGPVTNFDSFTFVPGSWYCNNSATSAPSTHAYHGIAYVHANPAFVVLEGYDVVEPVAGRKWVRRMDAGVWGDWTPIDKAMSLTGGTMTGTLTTADAGVTIGSSTPAKSIVVTASAGFHAALAFIMPGVFGANFGMAENGNFYMGGVSHPTAYQFWTTKDYNYIPANKAGDTFGGPVIATEFRSATSNLLLSTASAGNVVLRPNGAGSTAGQLALDAAGAVAINGALAASGTFSAGGSATLLGASNIIGNGASAGSAALVYVNFAGGPTGGLAFRPATDGTNACAFTAAAGTLVGAIATTASVTSYLTSSDGRLKSDLRPFDAGAMIDACQAYDFAWADGSRGYGAVAQELAQVMPSAVTHDEANDWWGVDYSKMVPVLLEAVKDLRREVAELRARKLT